MWTLSRIDIVGFPVYACGHNYLLLKGPKGCCLAHLKVEVPTALSSSRKLPFYKYWPYLFFTNKLEARVACTTELTRIQAVIAGFKSTCSFKCQTWELDSEKAEGLFKKLTDQEHLGHFCFAGKSISPPVGGGANCMDWVKHILNENQITRMGAKTSLDELSEIVLGETITFQSQRSILT